jgi:VCBS repeat-containing protein
MADNDHLSVTAVNGSAAAIGTDITLKSGAYLTLAADGSFTYDPAGAFDYLSAGQTATDHVNYTISDGHGGVATGLSMS